MFCIKISHDFCTSDYLHSNFVWLFEFCYGSVKCTREHENDLCNDSFSTIFSSNCIFLASWLSNSTKLYKNITQMFHKNHYKEKQINNKNEIKKNRVS